MSYKEAVISAVQAIEVTCEGTIAAVRRSTLLEVLDILVATPDDHADDVARLQDRISTLTRQLIELQECNDNLMLTRDLSEADNSDLKQDLRIAQAKLSVFYLVFGKDAPAL